jgi:phage gp29-like protein
MITFARSIISKVLSRLRLKKPPVSAAKVRPDEEIADTIIDGFSATTDLVTNPDDLVKKKGLEIYSEMLVDDQVYAISTTKKLAMLAPGWTIHPATYSRRDVAIADFVKWNLVRMPGTFRNALFHILTALDYGFSLTEKVWTLVKDKPKYNGLVGLKYLKPKNPLMFEFKMDEFGNMLGIDQIYMGNSRAAVSRAKARAQGSLEGLLPYDKFVHYAYNSRFGNPYGRSDLRAAYLPWIEKKMIRRFWNIYLERFGAPPVVAEVPRNASVAEINKIKEVLWNIQTRTGITIPENFKLDLLEPQRSGSANYELALLDKNMAIAHAILMPDLIGFSGGDHVGSFALGKAHVDIFFLILQKIIRDIEDDIVGEQIIKPLVDYNFKVSDYPRFKFEPLKTEGRAIRAKIISILVDIAVISPREPWIRDFVEIPHVAENFPQSEQKVDDPTAVKLDKILHKLSIVPATEDEKKSRGGGGGGVDVEGGTGKRPAAGGVEVQSLRLSEDATATITYDEEA